MIPGYENLEEIFRGRKRVVYRGRRKVDGKSVIVKSLVDELPSAADIAALAREYQILQDLHIEGIAKPLAFERNVKIPALILEDVGGESLRKYMDSHNGGSSFAKDLPAFLNVAIQFATTLGQLHQNNIIHKDINPKNVIFNQKTGKIQIIDFSISSRVPRLDQKISHPDMLEGTLAYISPEQTGRMNRSIDYRTDFYSLGVTLYEMLTGKLPFESLDPLELVHWHIARNPQPPNEITAEIPEILSQIVLKLLSKTAEDRYPSGFSLKLDLERCLRQLKASGKIDLFVPGQQETSDRFNIPQKLYGRKEELKSLLEAFERACNGGVELMLVSGYSGIGKTSLIHEVHKPMVARKGYFTGGKFDQLNRVVPYSAVIAAFQELVRQLLTESAERIQFWKSSLIEVLQPNAQIIIDVIPEVGLIIGEQPPVPELGPTEAQNRFNRVFQNFISVFTKAEHPLVIFLDDLQWADSATMKLLLALATHPDMHHLFVIGAYRDNEVSAGHLLPLILSQIVKDGGSYSTIALAPLAPEDLNQFIADTINCERDFAKPLADLVMSKTLGNPFFVTQFLKMLYQESLVSFNYDTHRWEFDLHKIQNLEMTDNVVELMARKIQKFPEITQHALTMAACIGNRFDTETLSIVSEQSVDKTREQIWRAIQEGLIVPLDENEVSGRDYKFLHDRVQQAAYELIPESRKKQVHLKIGRLMLSYSTDAQRDENIFEIVNQMNLGKDLIGSGEDRFHLARLNVQAGIKAKSSTAYEAALGYFNTAIGLLSENCWDSDYAFTFDARLQAAECNYLCGRLEQAEKEFVVLLARARSKLDRARAYYLMILQYENLSRYFDAIRVGHEALALFGLTFPQRREEKLAALEQEIQAIDALVGGRPIDSLIDIPAMTDPETRAVMKLLSNLHTSCYLSGDQPLTLLNTAAMVRLSLTSGNMEESAYGYVLYAAMLLVPLRRDFKSAYEFGMLAQQVNDRFHNLAVRARVLMNFGWAINLWRKPLQTSIAISREAFRLGNENGLFVEASYALFNESWLYLLSGPELSTFRKSFSTNVDYNKRVKMHRFADAQQVILQWGKALEGFTNFPVSFTDDHFDEEAFRLNYRGNSLFEMFYFVGKLAVLYTFEEYQQALAVSEQAERVIRDFTGTIWDELTIFYKALTLAALGLLENENKLKQFSEKLRLLAENAPYTFRLHSLILSAEIARLSGNAAEAMQYYESAITESASFECPRERALANELYAKFWLLRNNQRIARIYMMEAHHAYRQWGATAKARSLERNYSELLMQKESTGDLPGALSTSYTQPGSLDAFAVAKAAQAISSEIVLEKLLEKLLRIIMENAGAQKALLIEERGSNYIVLAEGAVDRIEVLDGERTPQFSVAIVNYVKRTSESLVLGNAVEDARFSNDPYIKETLPKSVMCLPILHQTRLVGLLYLENNLTTHAFTPDRIQVAQTLSSQSAISLEISRLYEDMKQEIGQRKRSEIILTQTAEELRFVNDLVEQTTQPMAVADFEGRLVKFNRAYELLTGYSAGELRKMTYRDLTPAAWYKMESDHISRLMGGSGTIRYEKEYKRKDGSVVPVELVVDIYKSASGEPVYLYAFVTDITERKRAEEALRKALSEVEQLKNKLQAENIYLQEEIKSRQNFEEIIGGSPAIKKVFENIEKVARTDSTVLITGETGTGKELVARAIHNRSKRAKSALITVNCAALPAGLIESELFGHEKGAFTGATSRKKGRFELADGGSIFLDEVGELPLETQTKLLRVLQEQEFERVGGSQILKVNVRVIAATNRDLDRIVKIGAFRADLFYRLNIFPVLLPALRERREDIPLLTNYFMNKFARRMGKRIDRISSPAREMLVSYSWPGNVRELANILERAVILCDGRILEPEHLSISSLPPAIESPLSTLEETERMHITKALEKTKWVIGGPAGAAKLLGIKRTTLLARMKKLQVERPKLY
jgi:PAS domain S-box-containing protein